MNNPVRHWRTIKLNDELLDVKPEICIERARLVTKAYQENEGDPMVLKRAKTISKVLNEMTIFIQKDQLIVGAQASSLRVAPLFPETESTYLEEEIDLFEKREQDRLIVKDNIKKELLEDILPYWKNKDTKSLVLKALPEETKRLVTLQDQIFSVDIHMTGSIGHVIVNYEKVLGKGFAGLKEDINVKLSNLDMTQPDSSEKYELYCSMLIISDAIISFAHRYAAKARELARIEEDERWKKELLSIAEICDNVPEKPAENFREAVQSFWFSHLLLYIEQNGLAVSVGRFDQFMYPYYKKSIEEGSIVDGEVQELLECLWIKFTEIMRAYSYESAKYYAGFSISENLVLGGIDATGEDVTNELSLMCLEAERNTLLPQPNLAVRVHTKSPKHFLKKAVDVVSSGRSKPEFFNDDVGISVLMSSGVPLEEARDYSISGCVEAVPPHCNGMTNAAMSNIAKALELALNDGVCQLKEIQIGPNTGDPNNFNNIEDVIKAFKIQVEAYVKHMVIALQIIEKIHAKHFPLPYFSLVLDDCIEVGLDVTSGGARYNYTGPQAVGFADVANSLAALKKLIFEEKSITMHELLDAMRNDFNGKEILRQQLINKAPKWGNDEDYVDEIAAEVAQIYCDTVSKYKNTRGGIYRPGIYSVSGNVPLGQHVGALPNGKLKRGALADGIGPEHGTDKFGPTAIASSASKLNHKIITNGTILNQKFTPTLLKDERGKEGLLDLILGYFDMGGWHIQFNVVSSETLRAAQENPQEHKGLIIRVAGYSAFFTELDRGVQDDIILRTEQSTF